MIEILKAKISELEEDKKEYKNKTYDDYELKSHLDDYIKLANLDYAIRMLKDMLIEELKKKSKI